LQAFALLQAITPVCTTTGLRWGPTGSVGFELASGVVTVTESSDLDLLLRAPLALDHASARSLFIELTHFSGRFNTRIDTQIETPNGAFSLAEFAHSGTHSGTRVMLRAADGPRLVADPWQTLSLAA
jgi:phosphoribosyl-dephospho-CoA transferase